MELTKRANGEFYKFASIELIAAFVSLAKEAQLDHLSIKEMLDGLENSNIDRANESFLEA